jgi:hypothetical protein
MEMTGSSKKTTAAWFLDSTHTLMSHTCNYFQKKILGLTPVSLAGPGMCQYNVLSDPNLVDRAQIWQQSKVSSDCLSECSELSQMKFPTY